MGSFVSRASSNDPTAVQVWKAREFGSKEYNGIRLSAQELGKRFDLIRTRQTAEIINRKVKSTLILVPELREIYFGTAESLSYEELEEQFPNLFAN